MDVLQGFGTALLEGAWITLELALASLAVGLVLGLLGAAGKLSRFLLLRWIADAYTTIVRGVPELLVILLIYFGGTMVLSELLKTYVEVSPFAAGVTALGLLFGAYSTEVFRGAFLAVSKGQVEAARAYGMSTWLAFRRIQLPQVWRFALPGLGNLWLVLLKDTALVSIIGLEDLMRKAKIAAEFTKQPFTFYLAAALLYLALTVVSMAGLYFLEQRTSRGVRRA